MTVPPTIKKERNIVVPKDITVPVSFISHSLIYGYKSLFNESIHYLDRYLMIILLIQ